MKDRKKSRNDHSVFRKISKKVVYPILGVSLFVTGCAVSEQDSQDHDSFISGLYEAAKQYGQDAKNDRREALDQVLKEIDQQIDSSYLYKADYQKMDDAAVKAYVAAMGDKYAAYYTPKEFQRLKEDRSGKYRGLGIVMQYDKDDGHYHITNVYKGFGADKAGIKPGTVILKLNDREMTLNDANDIIADVKAKEVGAEVNLEVLENGESKTYKIKIEDIVREIVTGKMLNDGILYISMQEFDEVTHEQLMKVYRANAKSAKGIILDLRDNPGGDLRAVLNVAGEFLDKGVITYTEDKDKKRQDYNADGKKSIRQPVVVLVNQYSASAAELLTGALKDYGRAVIVGTKTYGKGVVQEIRPLKNGGAFKQTVQKYFTPKGHNIDGTGIIPDVVIEGDHTGEPLEKQPEIQKATELLTKGQ